MGDEGATDSAHRQVREKVNLLPERPGVYLFKDAAGELIYVGKAASLRGRVRSYFRGGRHLAARTLNLVQQVADLDHIVTDNEVEALILECNLIKKHRPRFNVKLRDDKSYPYLRIGAGEPWPRVAIARSLKHDGARYFGPFTQSAALQETLRTLRRAFPYRTCSDARFRQHRDRPCLHYYIHRCLAPCAGLSSPEDYGEMIHQLTLFLEGRQGELLNRLRGEMEEAAERLDFERAAALRDKLRALERAVEKQRVVSGRLADQDAIALARPEGGSGPGDDASVQVFFVREGKVVGREAFLVTAVAGAGDGEVLGAFVKQYYADAAFIPREILIETPVDDGPAIEAWLSGRRGGRVSLTVPRRGEKRRLVELVKKNAALFLDEERLRRQGQEEPEEALRELAAVLGLAGAPGRIECYDISNIQGRQAVGSMAVFENGRPARNRYRRFRIRTVPGPDDYAMMREVLERRFRRGLGGGGTGSGEGFGRLPDLVLIDGGRGQVGAARTVLEGLGLGRLPVFGLAKENEWLFAPDRPEPVVLDRHSPALRLLQRLRDEAHREAVGYHRKLHNRFSLRSLLEDVPGIGPKRRKALLNRFKSLDAIRGATVDEVAAVPGMTRALAEEVLAYLSEGNEP